MDLTATAGIDLDSFAAEVGGPEAGPVTVTGLGTRGGAAPGVRTVRPPAGIAWIQASEMTACCGAATPVDDLTAALAEVGQSVALPPGGTVGGALAVGRSRIDRLGVGPLRDTLLQARYVSAAGDIVKAGGPTVKNVSGFDLCRLLVGSFGRLGFLGEVILRTKPLPLSSQWFAGEIDPFGVQLAVFRPAAVLWDGATTWVRLDGHPDDIAASAARLQVVAVDGPPELPRGGRWSLPPSRLRSLPRGEGRFVAEVGVGVVHHERPAPVTHADPTVVALHRRLLDGFDPTRRLNPGAGTTTLLAAS
jgi:glycolate dehydrogenase FAD-binding subunit